jgi:hypothetical protein
METTNSSIFNFKSFLIKFIIPIFFIVIITLYFTNSIFEKYIILKTDISGAYKVNRLINYNYTNEIPIFGSSRAEGSFIPYYIDKNMFNYGMSSTQENVTLALLKIEVKKNKKTPIIINFDLDGVNSNIGDISNYLYNNDNLIVKNLIKNNVQPFQYNFLFKYYGNYEFYIKNYLNNKYNFTKYTNNGASVEINKLTKSSFDKLVYERYNSINTFENDTVIFNNILNIIQNTQNRIFIFVIAPYHQSYFHNFISIEKYNNLKNLLVKYKNVKVFDFKDQYYDDTLFINTTHLNLQGAIKFSKSFKDSLTKLKII